MTQMVLHRSCPFGGTKWNCEYRRRVFCHNQREETKRIQKNPKELCDWKQIKNIEAEG